MSYNAYYMLCRSYIDLLQLRVACRHRILKLKAKPEPNEDILKTLETYEDRLKNEERQLLRDARSLFQNHPVFAYCKRVKGMGEVAALMLLGYINPEKATSAGKALKYFGLFPGSAIRSGRKASFNPEAKGRDCEEASCRLYI